MLNLSAWEGYSTLGLAYVRNGKWHRVPQSRRTLRYSAVHSDGFRISVPYPRMPAFATADAGEGQGLTAYHVECLDGAPCESRDTLRIDGVLAFEGWLAADTLAGRTADSVSAILERAGEPVLSAPLVGRARSDVSAYFQKAGLLRSGFHGQVDMRGLQGRYRLGMAYLADGRWHRLPGFQKIVIVGKME